MSEERGVGVGLVVSACCLLVSGAAGIGAAMTISGWRAVSLYFVGIVAVSLAGGLLLWLRREWDWR